MALGRSMTFMFLMLLCSGCRVVSTAPVASGEAVDADPYVGHWRIVPGSDPSTGGDLDIGVNEDNTITGIFTSTIGVSDTMSETLAVQLTTVNDSVIASVATAETGSESSQWAVFRVVLDNEDDTDVMMLYPLSPVEIQSGINGSDIAGEIPPSYSDAPIQVRASASEFRTFLETHPGAFLTDPALTLERPHQEASAALSEKRLASTAVSGAAILGVLLVIGASYKRRRAIRSP